MTLNERNKGRAQAMAEMVGNNNDEKLQKSHPEKVVKAIEEHISHQDQGGKHFKTIKYYSSKIDIIWHAFTLYFYKNDDILFTVKTYNRGSGEAETSTILQVIRERLERTNYSNKEAVFNKIKNRIEFLLDNRTEVNKYYQDLNNELVNGEYI